MPARKKSRRACRDYEREWNGLCVDKNLENDWLVRLNNLQCFRPISICEGHAWRKVGSTRTYPHVKLRLQEQFLSGIAGQWDRLKPVISDELPRLFQPADTYVEVDLRFRLRWGGSRFPYREHLSVRIHGRQAKASKKMDATTYAWFEQTVRRIEKLDSTVAAQICCAD